VILWQKEDEKEEAECHEEKHILKNQRQRTQLKAGPFTRSGVAGESASAGKNKTQTLRPVLLAVRRPGPFLRKAE